MRKRLDDLLVARRLVASRARARGLILRGRVRIDGAVAAKAGHLVSESETIELAGGTDDWISFGAEKLAAALDAFGPAFDPRDRIALDVGASTGGFTEVLLRRGARRVYAVDVGRDQLHESLKDDPRVVSREACDARLLDTALIPDPIAAVVADVSFISLTKALPAALALAAPDAWLVALIKPQFEAGRAAVGKGGIVRSSEAQAAAVDQVRSWLRDEAGWTIADCIRAPGLADRANAEFLIGAQRNG